MTDVDIAIVGGGLVGASLAVALRDSGLRIALIEAAATPVSEPAWDERCIALNDTSRRIFTAFGVWPALEAAAEAIVSTHISERGRFGVARFDAASEGLATLGHNLPLRAIGEALLAQLDGHAGLQRLQPARVVGLEPGDAAVSLTLALGAERREARFRARLVVAADGAQSSVRTLLGIGADLRDYRQQAIVTAVRPARAHGGVAYERFTPDGPLALIPKPDGAMSLVWTTPDDQVAERMAWDDARFLAEAEAVFGGRLGRFRALGRRWAWPLSRVLAQRLTAPRTVLIGNAAQSLHPVAAQGFNLGLRDVANLAERLLAAADPGDGRLLADYALSRGNDRARVADLTDLMVRSFSNRTPGLAAARHWGLVAVDVLPGLRDSTLALHLGRLGLPRSVSAVP